MATERLVHIVDDDDAIRDSLEMALRSAGFDVRAYPSAESFLAQCLERTGCVVSDVRMPGMNGLALLRHLREERRSQPVVLITGHGDVRMAVSALKAGAADFLEKPFEVDELLATIEKALASETGKINGQATALAARRRLRELTPREREVLCQLVAGDSNKQVARTLGLSPRTIEFHRAHIMAKTGAKVLPELVRVFFEATGPDEVRT